MTFRRLSSPLGCAGSGAPGLAAEFGVSGANLVAASPQPRASESNKAARARRVILAAFSNRTDGGSFREVPRGFRTHPSKRTRATTLLFPAVQQFELRLEQLEKASRKFGSG